MKILYFDCFSGISGDMAVGALLDAGGDFSYLKKELKKLPIEDEYEISIRQVNKNGITGTKFEVTQLNNTEKHYHDTHHDHRTYKHIVNMISKSNLTENAKDMSLHIFKKIGEAEGKIHGIQLDDVHFHEVGAIDSIIDIVGVAILMDQLKIELVKSSPLPTGSGKVKIDHGIYPIPAPATLEILRGIPIIQSELKAELTTPTGAGIAVVLADEFCTIPSMKITKIGYGAGTKEFPKHPNMLRIMIGRTQT